MDAALDEARALGEAPLLVITGGEPLQHPGIEALIDAALARWSRVEIETSGIAPPPRSHERLAWNVSPKLPSATPRSADTWQHLAAWLAEPRATLKVVVADDADLDEVTRRMAQHAIPPERIMLMPEGLTDEVLRERARWLAEGCKRLGVRMSPRLHIWMWGRGAAYERAGRGCCCRADSIPRPAWRGRGIAASLRDARVSTRRARGTRRRASGRWARRASRGPGEPRAIGGSRSPRIWRCRATGGCWRRVCR